MSLSFKLDNFFISGVDIFGVDGFFLNVCNKKKESGDDLCNM